MPKPASRAAALIALLLSPGLAMAAEAANSRLDLTNQWVGSVSVAMFIAAYLFVTAKEFTCLRKCKPGIVVVHGLFAGRDVLQDDAFGKFDRLTPR